MEGLKFKNYTVFGPGGQVLFSTTFNLPINIKQDMFNLIYHDLTSFTDLNLNFAVKTLLSFSFKLGDNRYEFEIERDYKSKTFRVMMNREQLAEDIYTRLSTLLGVKFEVGVLKNLFFDLTKKVFRSESELETLINQSSVQIKPTIPVDDLTEKVKTQIGDPVKFEKVEEILEIRFRGLKLQNQIKEFENSKGALDQIGRDIKSKESALKNIEDKLLSANSLLEKRVEVVKKLSNYGTLANDPSLSDRVQTLKKNRLGGVVKFMQNVKTKIWQNSINPDGPEDEIDKNISSLSTQITYFGMLLFVHSIVSLSLYLVSKNKLALGVFGAGVITIGILLLLFRFSRKNFRTHLPNVLDLKNDGIDSLNQKINPRENEFFVTAAWVSAYKTELQSLDESIKLRLGDYSLSQIMLEKDKLQSEIEELSSRKAELEETALNTDDYYKRRREMDMLKIEEENLQFEIKDYSAIAGLVDQYYEFKSAESHEIDLVEERSFVLKNMPVIFMGGASLNPEASQIKDRLISMYNGVRQFVQINIVV